jgi:hypothetical protein
MARPIHYAVRLAVLLVALACASPSGGPRAAPRDRSVLTSEDLQAQHFASAYAAIETLRSIWLQPRGTDSFLNPSVIWVYLDNDKLGGVEALKGLDVNAIASIQRLDGKEATARWGMGHGAGAILVSSARARAPTP